MLIVQSIVLHSFVHAFSPSHPFVFGNHDNISSSASAPKSTVLPWLFKEQESDVQEICAHSFLYNAY